MEWFAFQKNNYEVDEEEGGRVQAKKLKAGPLLQLYKQETEDLSYGSGGGATE